VVEAMAAEFRLSFELTNIRVNVLLTGGASLQFEVDRVAKVGADQISNDMEFLGIQKVMVGIVKPNGKWSVLDIENVYLRKRYAQTE
jgi:hypothetical protein